MILKRLKIENSISSYTNCYIGVDENKKEGMVIDPAGECEKILDMLDILGVNLKYIYLKLLIHRIESENLKDEGINLSAELGIKNVEIEADARVDDGDILHVGDIELKVIHTPGHTNGGSSLYIEKEKIVFTGDTIFKGTYRKI